MRILFLSHHWVNNSHHSRYSGFQRLVTEAAKSNQVTLVTWGEKDDDSTDPSGIRVITVRGGKRDFFFSKRMAISRKGEQIAKDFDIVHSLYSDCSFHLRDQSYTVTFHVLPGVTIYHEWKQKIFIWLKYRIIQERAFKRAKAIVCVSRNLLVRIPKKFAHKSQFIPHGVDTAFWDPALANYSEHIDGKPYLLCVGSHGADLSTLKELVTRNSGIRFVLLGLGDELVQCGNVQKLSRVSDEELRNLYYGAMAVVKPLLFATANNSLLEALSMGKTVVTNRIDGVKDYVDDTTCVFIENLPNLDLSGLTNQTLDQGQIRRFAINKYSWKVILEQYLRCY